jgi:hypothetical protein
MAVNIDRDWKTGDVTRMSFDEDIERSNASTQSLWADAKVVDPFEQLAFDVGIERIGIALTNVSQ